MTRMKYAGALLLSAMLTSCGGSQACDCAAAEARAAADARAEVLAEVERRAAADVGPLPGDDAERIRMDVADAPARGAAEPLVTIVMFSDFQCPFCSRVEPTLDRLLETFPEEVRIVWRNNPLDFHQNAMPAAEAAMEAFAQGGDELFWRYHAILFENQRALGYADLKRYGQSVGLEPSGLQRALDEHTHRERIDADRQAAATAGARGTPTFFINGRKLAGAQPYAAFERIVREEIAIARREMARGVARGELYAHFMRDAREAPGPEPEPTPTGRQVHDPSAVYRVPVDGRPARGPADALVTIVMFSDFQCPFCARAQVTLEQVTDHYGQDVRIVYRHNPLPFHHDAMPAAEAAVEVFQQRGAEAFFRYHDLLFENQRALDRASLVDMARRAGARPSEVERALGDHRHRAAIEADQGLARQLGATGTPTFFINGRQLRGAQPFEAFEALIDEELARARERVAAGTPRARVYEETIEHGATTPQLIDGPAHVAAAPAPEPDVVYTIPVPRDAPSRGPRNARVTIQLFSDFQCPFCNRVRPTLERVLQEYPDDVRLVFRNYPLPFHQNAMPAAEAAREVFRQRGSDAFWEYHDLLFDNQRSLDTDTLVRLAGTIRGVRESRVRRALERGTHRDAIEADMDAVREAGARIGTPSCFINGRLVQGAQPYDVFRAAIERALAEPE